MLFHRLVSRFAGQSYGDEDVNATGQKCPVFLRYLGTSVVQVSYDTDF